MNKLEEGKRYFNEQHFEKAIVAFCHFLKENTNHGDALFFRALSYRKIGKYHDSINDFNALISRLPEEASLYAERGISYYHLKMYEKSDEDLTHAVDLEPNNSFRYSSRAYIRAYLDIDGAIADYEKAIELDPKDEIALNNLGLLQDNKGNIKEAQKRFKQSNELIGYDPIKRTAEEDGEIEKLPKKSISRVMLEVFTTKKIRQEYFNFLKGFFKK